jgi:hypothetical protein
VQLAWFLLSLSAAAAVLVVIRRFFDVGRVRRRIAFPLAVAERALEDALGELAAEGTAAGLFVSPFEAVVSHLARPSEAELCSLGGQAADGRRRLLEAVQAWNAGAGGEREAAALLPLLLSAHKAARELAAHVEGERLQEARASAEGRVLVALVGRSSPPPPWVH